MTKKKKTPLNIRVMADYGSLGIWGFPEKSVSAFRHGMIEHNDLNLPKELRKKFESWIDTYEEHNFNSTLDIEAFNKQGHALAKALKK